MNRKDIIDLIETILITFCAVAILIWILSDDVSGKVEVEDTFISDEYIEICNEVGEDYHISPELLEAIIETESSGKQYAVNGSCKGLCQINEYYHRDRMKQLGITDVYDSKSNITLAADIIKENYDRYGDDLMLVLMAYNGTAHAAEKAQGGQFSDYADKVSKRAEELEALHGKKDYSQYMTDTKLLEWRAKDE